MSYCRQSACNSHEGMLWVQLQPLSVRQMLVLSRRTMQVNREKGRRVDVIGLLHVLSEAFDSNIWPTPVRLQRQNILFCSVFRDKTDAVGG